MRRLSLDQYLTEGDGAYKSVFDQPWSYGLHMFQPTLPRMTLLYPVPNILDRDVLSALFPALALSGESDAVLFRSTESDPIDDFHERGLICEFKQTDIEQFLTTANGSINSVLMNGFFSPQGTWGIATNADSAAYFAGSNQLVDAFFDQYPHTEEGQAEELLANWHFYFDLPETHQGFGAKRGDPAESPSLPLIFAKFRRMYGPSRAEELLRRRSLPIPQFTEPDSA